MPPPSARLADSQSLAEREPRNPAAWQTLGNEQLRAGATAAAIDSFAKLVELSPQDAQAHNLLGVATAREGGQEKALGHFQAALQRNPRHASAWHNQGVAQTDLKRPADAAVSFQKAVEIDPNYIEARHHLALALRDLGRKEEALAVLRRAVELAPDAWPIAHDFGLILNETGRHGEAAGVMRRVLRASPKSADAHNTLGLAHLGTGRFPDAEASFEQAARLNPTYTLAHTNLGTALKEQGRLDEAIVMYEHAVRIDPQSPSAHWNLSLALLQAGHYERGWREYEWRFRRPVSPRRAFAQPVWDGSALDGKILLLHVEQGLGDTLQFIRYAPMIQARGGRVIFESPSPLAQLLRGVEGVDPLIVEGEPHPHFDVQLPLMSARFVFGTTLSTVPAPNPYLAPEPDRVARWAEPINTRAAGRLKIGLAWQGNPHHQLDRFRSLRLDWFLHVAPPDRVAFFSLQRGPGAEQLDRWAKPIGIHELTSRSVDSPADWPDTAAIVQNLDLVICVDTAIAHLAGAMNVPTWLLLSAAPDWRWLLHRRDTPWYPATTLFRQRTLGDWSEVMTQLRGALASHSPGAIL